VAVVLTVVVKVGKETLGGKKGSRFRKGREHSMQTFTVKELSSGRVLAGTT